MCRLGDRSCRDRPEGGVMTRKLMMSVVASLVFIGNAYAQDLGTGAGRVEVSAFPGGAMFFTQSSNGKEPDFGNYALGGSFTVNVNRWIGIEAEGGGSVGIHQNFSMGSKAYTD